MDHRRILRLDRRMPKNTFSFLPISILGSGLPNGTATVDGVSLGKDVCVARDDGSNQVTITFNEALSNIPIVYWATVNDEVRVKLGTVSATQIIYTTVDWDSNGSGISDANVNLLLMIPISVDAR